MVRLFGRTTRRALCALALTTTVVVSAPTAASADDGSATATSSPALKPGLEGLVVTQPTSIKTVPYAKFASVKLPWKDIETRAGGYDFSYVDKVLRENPGQKFRLRFMAGIHAPQWVKERSGGCVNVTPDSVNGNTGCVPRYWTDNYHADYVALMSAVAARYESNPQVVEIANSECTTIYAEPFILGADSASIDRLWSAGYTKAGHGTCLRRSTDALMNLFPTTRISLAGHSKWQFIVPGNGYGDGNFSASWEDERTLLNELHRKYGEHLVFDDHGLGPDDPTCPGGQPQAIASSWYCYMAGLSGTGSTYGWQFTLNGGSMTAAADAGVAMGACFLEFAAFQAIPEDKRREVHEALVANCDDATPPPDPEDPPPDPEGEVVNEQPPAVTGEPNVNQPLVADPGVWSPTPDSVDFQWLNNGDPIPDATDSTYVVQLADVGDRITVQVTATVADLAPGSAVSDKVRVDKLDTNTHARLPRAVTHSRRPVVVVTVQAEAGITHGKGKVIVTSHGRRVGKAWLHDGRARVRLHRMAPGRHKLIARFLPTPTMRYSRADAVRVFIKR